MPNNSLRRNSLFIAGSALAGILLALLAMRLWPQLAGRSSASTPVATIGTGPETQPAALDASGDAAGSGPTMDGVTNSALEQATQGSFAGAVRASAPAVVSIYTLSVDRAPVSRLDQLLGAPGRPRVQRNLGSGVIVDARGHIVTNYHVVSRSVEIAVQLADGRAAAARLVGSDPDTDLAVLQVELPDMPVMRLGRSDRVAVGDVVLAIGNPFGQLAQTVTHGIISATGRADLGVATYEDFIQTDAAINDGNSGGALVNTRGELIGLNTAVLGKEQGAEGLGVAIPVDLVRGVMSEILLRGRVIRGGIGIDPRDIPAAVAREAGLPRAGVAIYVYPGSTAEAAGLRRGDLVRSIDGQDVRSAQDVRARIAGHKPGATVRIVVDRISGQQQFEVAVEEARPSQVR